MKRQSTKQKSGERIFKADSKNTKTLNFTYLRDKQEVIWLEIMNL